MYYISLKYVLKMCVSLFNLQDHINFIFMKSILIIAVIFCNNIYFDLLKNKYMLVSILVAMLTSLCF